MTFDPSTATAFDPTSAQPAGGFDPSSARPVAAATPNGYGAIPVGPGETRPVAPPQAPPTFSDKLTGAVEAGLNFATQMVGGTVGMVTALPASAISAGGAAVRGMTGGRRLPGPLGVLAGATDRFMTPTEAMGEVGGAVTTQLKRLISGPMDLSQEQTPDTDLGETYTRHYVEPVMNTLGALGGHVPEVTNIHALAKPAVEQTAAAVGPKGVAVANAGERAIGAAARKVLPVDPELAKVAQIAGDLKHPIDVRPDQIIENAKFSKLAGQAAADVPLANSKSASNQVAFTRNLIDMLNPEEVKADRLTPDVFDKAMRRSGEGIGEITARTPIPEADLVPGLDHAIDLSKATEDNRRIVTSYIADIKNAAEEGAGKIDGTRLKEINSEIGKQARSNADSDLGRYLNDLQDTIQEAVARNASPEDVAALRDFRRQYAYGKMVEPLVAKTIDGKVSPQGLMARVTATKAGKHFMARSMGGPIGDLAKVGQLIKEPGSSLTTERGLIYGAGLGGAGYIEPHSAAAAYGSALAYNTLGPKLTRAMVGKKAKPAPKAPPAPPPEPTTSPGAGGPRGGGGGGGPGPLGDLTPDWQTTPGAGGGKPRGGHEPGLVRAVDETEPLPQGVPGKPGEQIPLHEPRPLGDLTPEWETTPGAGGAARRGEEPGLHRAAGEPPLPAGKRREKLEIPAVPGRPDLPDTVVAGRPSELALDKRTQEAMNEPGAIEARRKQTEAAEHARRAAEPRVPVGEVKEGQPEIKPGKTGPIPVGKVIEGQPEIAAKEPKKPIPKGEATELPVEHIEPKAPIDTGEVVDLTPEQEAAWRKEFGLSDHEAGRATAVAEALKHDEKAVEAAAVQHENSPRAFDREIERINEEAKNANESKPAAEGGEGAAAPSGEAQLDTTAATGTPGERAGPDSAGAAGERGAEGAAGGQAPAGAARNLEDRLKYEHGFTILGGGHAVDIRAADGRVREGLVYIPSRGYPKLTVKEQTNRGTPILKHFSVRGDMLRPEGDTTSPVAIADFDSKVGGKRATVDLKPGAAGGQAPAGPTPLVKPKPAPEPVAPGGLEIRETDRGFEAYRDGKKVGYLHDNLKRGQAEQLGENASVEMVKVHESERGKREVGPALYKAFNEKHGGRIQPNGKTEPGAWKLWKREYPEKVEEFVQQEAQRIADGADSQMVLGNIKDAEVAQRVSDAVAKIPPKPTPKTFASPIVKGMVEAAQASAEELRSRISNVKWGDAATNSITFDLDGKPHEARLKGRNADAILSGTDSETDRAVAARTLLDKDAEPVKPSSREWRDAGKTPEQLLADKVEHSARESARTIAEEAKTHDFAPSDIPKMVRQWADQDKVPADDLRQAVIKALDETDISDARKAQVLKALDPTKTPLVPSTEPTIVKTTNDPLEGKVYHVQIPGDDRVFQINRGDNNLGGPTWMIDAGDHWSQGPAPSQNGYVSTHLGDTKAEALRNLADKVQAFDAQPGYKQGLKRGSAAPAPAPAPTPFVPKTTSDIGRTYFDRGPEQLSEAEFGAVEKAKTLVRLRDELKDAKAGKLQTGPFSMYTSKAAAVREISALIDSTERAKPERYASDHLAEINKAIAEGKTPSPENVKRYDLEAVHGKRLLPDDLQSEAGEKAVPGVEPPEEIFSAENTSIEAQQKAVADYKEGNLHGVKPLGSPEAVEAVLREKFGHKLIDGLHAQGLLKYALAMDEGMGTPDKRGVKAIFRQGSEEPPATTLYFDRLTADNAPGILMHELGEHYGAPRLLGLRYAGMMDELRTLAKTDPEVKAAWEHVERNYVGPDTAAKFENMDNPKAIREVAAHLVETQPDLPWVRRVINEVRAFFYEQFGTTMGNRVDANLVRGVAAAALRKASEGGLRGQRPTAQGFKPLVPSSRMPAPNRLQ